MQGCCLHAGLRLGLWLHIASIYQQGKQMSHTLQSRAPRCITGSPSSHQAALAACMPCQHAHACARSQSHTCSKPPACRDGLLPWPVPWSCAPTHHRMSAHEGVYHARMMLLACRPETGTLAAHREHLPARQTDVAHFAEQGTQMHHRQPIKPPSRLGSMHALSACACMCEVTEPHLLQAGVLQGGTVAVATALEFLSTGMSACAGICHGGMMLLACRPETGTLAEHRVRLPARQTDVAHFAEQGTQMHQRQPKLATKPPHQHACLVSMHMHVGAHRATLEQYFCRERLLPWPVLWRPCAQAHHWG